MPFVINRIPSEEFGIAIRSVGILTRTGTHLKLIRSCHNCNRQVADHFHPQIGGCQIFFSAFGRTPPPPSYPWFGIHVPLPPCHSLALGTVRTCPKVCLLSLVTDLLSESKILDKWSQVTPLSELIEMVQYETSYSLSRRIM